VLRPLIPKWRALKKKHPDLYQGGVYVSWDNARWHNPGTLLDGCKGLVFHRMPVPPQSHDIHKVTEHVINNLKRAADKYLNEHPEIQKLEDIKAAFTKLFFQEMKREGIRRDIRSLRATYRVINYSKAKGGVARGWAPKKYRYGGKQCSRQTQVAWVNSVCNTPDRAQRSLMVVDRTRCAAARHRRRHPHCLPSSGLQQLRALPKNAQGKAKPFVKILAAGFRCNWTAERVTCHGSMPEVPDANTDHAPRIETRSAALSRNGFPR